MSIENVPEKQKRTAVCYDDPLIVPPNGMGGRRSPPSTPLLSQRWEKKRAAEWREAGGSERQEIFSKEFRIPVLGFLSLF